MHRGYIDLHIHTNASDGLLSPEEVVKISIERRLKAISITDHDTTDGFVKIIDNAHDNGLELISGVELSCLYMGVDVHILGYFIDYKDPGFVKNVNV